jgi:PEP-CTERM/exosortase A-associated glycosyltransferase
MNAKPTILHILNHSYPYADGYAIRSFNIINAQRRYGMEPIILTSPKHEPEYTTNPEMFEETWYYRTPAPGLRESNSPLANFQIIYALWRQIQRVYRARPFELMHAHSPSLCGLAAMLFALQTGIPFVYEVRAFWEDAAVDAGKYAPGSWKYRLTRALESLVLRRASAVTTIASYLKTDIEKRRGKRGRVFLVPNGVDCDHFHSSPPDEQLTAALGLGKTPVIGFIGSFYRFEGLNILLQSLARLKAQGVAYQAVLVGGGEMEAAWKQMATELKLTEVQFTGRVPHADVLRYYSVIDIFVYPRLKEQITELVTPLKPLEAMAMGKLALGSDVGGIRERLDHGKGGLLFPAENPDALAQLLKNILNHPNDYKALMAAGKEIANNKYSWSSHIVRYQKIYDEVRSLK